MTRGPLVLLSATLLICPLAVPVGGQSPAEDPPRAKLEPGRGQPGKTYDIKIFASNPETCKEEGKGLSGVTAHSPQGSDIDIKIMETFRCMANATIKVKPDATAEPKYVDLKDKSGNIVAIGVFEVAHVLPGPIPHGLRPSVDVMWSVLPKNIVQHNFGSKIAKHYYCIEIVIGNNTGYDLQIAAVGFEIEQARLPSVGYRTARGTLLLHQEVHARGIVVKTVKALGPILTGMTPAIEGVGRQALFAQAVNIFSNPFEKGIELIWPDLTIDKLSRLDDAILRDNYVVPNNAQRRTMVFFPKEVLGSVTDKGKTKPRRKIDDYDPKAIRKDLGELVLIGQEIQYLNRIRVTAQKDEETRPAPVVHDSSEIEIKRGETKSGTLRGLFEQDTTGEIPNLPGVSFKFGKVSADGRSLPYEITVPEKTEPGEDYQIVLRTGKTTAVKYLPLVVGQVPPEVSEQKLEPDRLKNWDADKKTLNKQEEVRLVVKGKFLDGDTQVEDPGKPWGIIPGGPRKAEFDQLEILLTAQEGTGIGDYPIRVKNRGGEVELTVTVNDDGALSIKKKESGEEKEEGKEEKKEEKKKEKKGEEENRKPGE